MSFSIEPAERSARPRILAPMAAMLFVAIALGLAYNSVSPLGVRFGQPQPQGSADVIAPPSSQRAPVPSRPSNAALPVQPPISNTVPVVKWADVKKRLGAGGLLLIDARPRSQYELDHIPGAISIPPETSEQDFLKLMMTYAKTEPIVVYCGSPTCHLSRALAQRLLNLGFTRVEDMEGGIIEYLAAQQESLK